MTKMRLGLSLLGAGLALGLTFASSAMAADPTEACAGCHGADGVSTDPHVPTIAGLSAAYLTSTMKAYADKQRPCAEATVASGAKKGSKTDMCAVAKETSAADVAALSAAYAGKKFVAAKQTADAALAAKGKDLHDKLCDKCHTEKGSVAEDDAGLLAGQWMPYLAAQLNDYKSGKRPVPTKMQPKLDQVQVGDIDALVNYYGAGK